MDKFEKHLINWLIIVFFLIIDLALIPLMFMYFWPEQASYIGDIFTWTGAIIGGSLTLIGVYITLEKQKRDKFIENYPNKIKSLDNVERVLKEIIDTDYFSTLSRSDIHYEYIQRRMEGYLSEIIEESTNINGVVYHVVKDIERRVIETLKELEENKEFNIYSQSEEGRMVLTIKSIEARLEYQKEFKSNMLEKQSYIKNFYRTLEEKYVRYTN